MYYAFFLLIIIISKNQPMTHEFGNTNPNFIILHACQTKTIDSGTYYSPSVYEFMTIN